MDDECRLSDSSDDSSASDQSIDRPPSLNKTVTYTCHYMTDRLERFDLKTSKLDLLKKKRHLHLGCPWGDGNQPEDTFQWTSKNIDELKRSIKKLKSKFERSYQTLNYQINKLLNTTDELESVHKNTTVGSLVGSTIGAVGGITTIAGLCMAPFTFGASLALTGAGAAIGAAGGLTGAASNITNMTKQKTLRETIELAINNFQSTINPMIEELSKIYKITEDIKLTEKTLNKIKIQRAARCAADILKIAKVADVAQIAKMCAEVAKEIRVYVKAVNAIRGPTQAARAVRAAAGTAKSIRTAAAATGALLALFLALDIYCIVQDSAELSEMNQPAEKREAEDINSETLMFIHQTRETAAAFQRILDKMKHAIYMM